jgi:hypothetical protein
MPDDGAVVNECFRGHNPFWIRSESSEFSLYFKFHRFELDLWRNVRKHAYEVLPVERSGNDAEQNPTRFISHLIGGNFTPT